MGSALLSMTLCSRLRAAFVPYASSHPTRPLPSTGRTSCASTTATIAERSAAFSATTATSLSATEEQRLFFKPPLSTFSVIPDEIESITAGGYEDVFDIQVDRTENFIAHGLVSHNTRWHDDDIPGRITDKTNPKYSARFAEGWEIVNLPAFAVDDDPLGRKPGEVLWPEQFNEATLREIEAANPVAFSALFQANPTPAEGIFYMAADLKTYTVEEWRDVQPTLRWHAASDHAVGTDQVNDKTCMGLFGVDPAGAAWVSPDLVWRRMAADVAVEEMLRLMQLRSPVYWYAEKGHISKSIAPFLKSRMQEEGVYCTIREDHPVGDKMQRAQSARAACARGQIKFPDFAAWWPEARVELLKFPNGKHDDFVDFLSIIGMKLQTHLPGKAMKRITRPEAGTWGDLKRQFEEEERRAQAGWANRTSGW